MSGADHHWLVRLYPRAWRERYGDELSELIACEGGGLRAGFDVVRAAALAHIVNPSCLGGATMSYRGNVAAMAKHPSAFVPLVLSGLALAELVAYLAIFGPGSGAEATDEGTAARLYQLLIGLQFLIIPWFALRWGWRDLRAGATLLVLQGLAIASSFVPLWLIEH